MTERNEDTLHAVQNGAAAAMDEIHNSWKAYAEKLHADRMYWMKRCGAAEQVIQIHLPNIESLKDSPSVDTWLDLKARE